MIGMANWLGVHRDTVHQWKTGATRSNTHYDLIKKAIDILEELWVDYMQNGKINPAWKEYVWIQRPAGFSCNAQ